MNLAARRSATEGSDAANSNAAKAGNGQQQVLPQRAAKSSAKRKRASESPAPEGGAQGASVTATTASINVPEQTAESIAKRPDCKQAAAAQELDPVQTVAAAEVKLALVEDDVDWAGEAAPE